MRKKKKWNSKDANGKEKGVQQKGKSKHSMIKISPGILILIMNLNG